MRLLPSKRQAGWFALAIGVVGGFEGLSTIAYRDPVGIPTICFGETAGVRMGDRKTPEECKALLADELAKYNDGVNGCVHVALPDARRAAIVSFTYNVGVAAFCHSSVARELNAGDPRGACDALLKWDKAAGIRLPGLTRRRQAERALCLQGIPT